MLNSMLKNGVQIRLRFKSDILLYLIDSRHTPLHVLEIFFECLVIGHQFNGGFRAGRLDHLLRKFPYGDLFGPADVENFPNRSVGFH